MLFAAITSLTILGTVLGLLLGIAARYFRVEVNPLVLEIEQLLPGTQCGQCGYPGCSGAAQALVDGNAPLSLCPPGGRAVVQALAAKLGVDADLSGVEDAIPMVAEVKEEICIGCTRCYKVCPTDAILGAAQQIHAVFREACIACGKCEEVCPTESVKLQPIPITLRGWYWHEPVIQSLKNASA
ncbi:MAG: RnfABCDGE type electron transport complex subunit B [Gallionella sp.]